MNNKPTDPHCRHGVPYYKDCEECELDMIRHVADQRMPERGLWAEVSGGKLEMTMNEADDLEALPRRIDALRKENEELLATLRQLIRETHPRTVGEVDAMGRRCGRRP
jgi:DnaJ-domain-containing protein 1